MRPLCRFLREAKGKSTEAIGCARGIAQSKWANWTLSIRQPIFDDMMANEQSRKGISEIEGKVAEGSDERMEPREACDIDGQTDRSNEAFGKSDIEGKAAIGSGERAGKRTSFK